MDFSLEFYIGEDLSYSIIVVGDLGVGKTSILHRYLKKTLMEPKLGTRETSTYTKTIEVNQEEVTLDITERRGIKYDSPMSDFYKNADGVIIVYDITKFQTFDHVRKWYRTIVRYTKVGTVFMMVGNKSDYIEERKIDKLAAEIYARSNGYLFMETSALLNKNIDEVFQKLADYIYFRKQADIYRLQNMRTRTENKSMSTNKKKKPCAGCCGRPLWRVILGIP